MSTRPELLINSIKNNNLKAVSDLINKGVDVNKQDNFNATPLMYSMQRGCKTEIVLLLLKSGAEINAFDTFNRTPLMYTTCVRCKIKSCKNEENILTLLRNGADINCRDFGGNNLLHLEICPHLIKLLVTAGVSLDMKDNGGDTPLMTHVLRENCSKVQTLLSLGADPDCRDRSLNTPLYNTQNREIIYLLLYFGASTNTKNANNEKPLSAHFERGWVDSGLVIIQHLLLLNDSAKNEFLNANKTVKNALDEYDIELGNMKKVNITNILSFYEFCNLKETKYSKFLNISRKQYLYDHNQIRGMFPHYGSIILLKIKYNCIEKFRNDMLKDLEKITVKPLGFDRNSSTPELNYDCLYIIGCLLNNEELYNFLTASI